MKRIIISCFMLVLLLVVCACDGNGENKSTSDYNSTNGSLPAYTSYTDATPKKPLTKEQAESYRGTGYNNTRPNSVAEDIELKAAQVKCEVCGNHSDNGLNSKCDSCQEKYGH